MSLDQSHLTCFTLLIFIIWFYTGRLKKCIILYFCPNYSAYVYKVLGIIPYKFCNLTSFIRLGRKIKNINNISLKFIMLTDNNQFLRNWFVIIHRHLTKVSAQIIQCIIFEGNELSITLSIYAINKEARFELVELR